MVRLASFSLLKVQITSSPAPMVSDKVSSVRVPEVAAAHTSQRYPIANGRVQFR